MEFDNMLALQVTIDACHAGRARCVESIQVISIHQALAGDTEKHGKTKTTRAFWSSSDTAAAPGKNSYS
jgi:hypothetical protein